MDVVDTALLIHDCVRRLQPDVVIVDSASPSRDTLENLGAVSSSCPRLVVAYVGKRYSRGVVLVTGHAGSVEGNPDWAALARCGLTLVIYMGVSRAESIARSLLRSGMAAHTPVVVICRAHLLQQRQAVCTLATVAESLTDADLVSPAVLVVGAVVQAAPLLQTLQPEGEPRAKAGMPKG